MSAEETAHQLPDEPTDLTDSQELYCMKRATNEDGSVIVKAHNWGRVPGKNSVKVEFITPTGDVESENMPWPQGRFDESEKFVRVLREAGYSVVDCENFGSNGRKLTADPDDWTLVAEEPRSKRERALDVVHSWPSLLKYPALGLWYLTVGHLGYLALFESNNPGAELSEEQYERMKGALTVVSFVDLIILTAMLL